MEHHTYSPRISLRVYLVVSGVLGGIINRYPRQAITVPSAMMSTSVAGDVFVSLTASYMTMIDHRKEANWVGFAGIYALGFDEFELNYAYQRVYAAPGVAMLVIG